MAGNSLGGERKELVRASFALASSHWSGSLQSFLITHCGTQVPQQKDRAYAAKKYEAHSGPTTPEVKLPDISSVFLAPISLFKFVLWGNNLPQKYQTNINDSKQKFA
eukprot:645100-Amphidinium_carterae.2